jgi:glycosyltransferase involved in cell wall biosynthesis
VEAVAGPNVRLLGRLPDAQRDEWLATARAFLFAAEEDFGIAPLEAQASGTPVIALGRGGALETIRGLDDATPTGVLFSEQTPEAIAAGVREFEANAHRITEGACRANAARFSADRFRREFGAFVATRQAEFAKNGRAR